MDNLKDQTTFEIFVQYDIQKLFKIGLKNDSFLIETRHGICF